MAETEKYEHPLRVNVIIPQANKPKQFGVHSTLHPTAGFFALRTNAEEKELIKKWHKELGMDAGTFIRECAINTCRELERLQNEYLKSLRSG